MHIHPAHMHVKYLVYMAYMPYFMGIFISGTYLATTGELEVAVGCWLYMHKFWLCKLYLERDSHMCSAIYVKYVHSTC